MLSNSSNVIKLKITTLSRLHPLNYYHHIKLESQPSNITLISMIPPSLNKCIAVGTVDFHFNLACSGPATKALPCAYKYEAKN